MDEKVFSLCGRYRGKFSEKIVNKQIHSFGNVSNFTNYNYSQQK